MSTAEVTLTPQVEVRCIVCGNDRHALICSASEVEAHIAYLARFHRRRLRLTGAELDAALADRAAFTQDYVTEIACCPTCGMVYRESRPRAAAVTAAYANDQYGAERLQSLFDSQLELARAKLVDLHHHMAGRRRPTVVEIGSFVGGFLAAGSELGWNVIGVDPGEEVTDFCRSKGLRVLRGTASDVEIEPGSVDCVAIWNTFDQLPDPRPTLTAARRWLRPEGLLVLRVPNGAAFAAAVRLLRRSPAQAQAVLLAAMAWNNLLAFPYLWGYSPSPLDRLLTSFEMTRVDMRPDTLIRLADANTKTWAAWEERALKLSWRAASELRPDRAPWLDAYYRQARSPAQS